MVARLRLPCESNPPAVTIWVGGLWPVFGLARVCPIWKVSRNEVARGGG